MLEINANYFVWSQLTHHDSISRHCALIHQPGSLMTIYHLREYLLAILYWRPCYQILLAILYLRRWLAFSGFLSLMPVVVDVYWIEFLVLVSTISRYLRLLGFRVTSKFTLPILSEITMTQIHLDNIYGLHDCFQLRSISRLVISSYGISASHTNPVCSVSHQ